MGQKKSGRLLRKNKKNTMAKLGRHLVSCPLLIGVKLCEKADCTSIIKFNDSDGVKRIRWDETKRRSFKEKQKLYLF